MKLHARMAALSKFNVGEAFGVPHTFNPNLSLLEAVFAVAVAFTRIFLGSLLFALWGVAGWTTWGAIGNPVLRIVAVLPIALLFFVSIAAMMVGISSLVDWLKPRGRAA
jgi:hypothetical protein